MTGDGSGPWWDRVVARSESEGGSNRGHPPGARVNINSQRRPLPTPRACPIGSTKSGDRWRPDGPCSVPAVEAAGPAAIHEGSDVSFAVERTSGRDGVCVAVAGEVDIDTAPRMRRALDAALEESSQVVVDLGAVTFMDSSGLSALIASQQRADAAGASLRLRHVPAMVLRLLDLTGIKSVFVFAPALSTELAAASMPPPGRDGRRPQ